jgi:hypothetical protein
MRRMGWTGIVAIAGAALPLAGCAPDAPSGPATCALSFATSIPLQVVEDGSALRIPARLDKTDIKLVVDTGSDVTVVSDQLLKLSETTMIDTDLEGIGGTKGATVAVLGKLELGRLHGAVTTLSSTLDQSLLADGEVGFLGMDIMGAYDIDLDVPGGELRLYAAPHRCAAPVAFLQGPLYSVDELPSEQGSETLVPVQIGDHTLVAQLDTGSPTVTLSARGAWRLGLDAKALQNDPSELVGGMGPRRLAAKVHVIPLMTLGDLQIAHVKADVLPENFDSKVDVLLGMDLATRIHFWLSNSSRSVIMQFPAQASPPVPAGT